MNGTSASWFGLAGALVIYAYLAPPSPDWPGAPLAGEDRTTTTVDADARAVESVPVCVGSRSWSAGELGKTVLYRTHRVGNTLYAGYFVYWTTERPWGTNALSYTLLPALATDAFYSHFLYVLPGAKDFVHGPGDVEGALVAFDVNADGTLTVKGGLADDGFHDAVRLSRDDLVDSKGRIVLMTDVWSHQLGSHGAAGFSNEATLRGDFDDHLRCYGAGALRPLSAPVARAFRLGSPEHPRRAGPAWANGLDGSG
jgi:hypothetical protein